VASAAAWVALGPLALLVTTALGVAVGATLRPDQMRVRPAGPGVSTPVEMSERPIDASGLVGSVGH
jgi:hypothetical protein